MKTLKFKALNKRIFVMNHSAFIRTNGMNDLRIMVGLLSFLNRLTRTYTTSTVLASKANTNLVSSINSSPQLEYTKEEFYSWLAGFSEAEGCFKINLSIEMVKNCT